MHAVLGSRAALASAARPVSRVSTAPPCRHSRRRCSAPTCTATRAVADFAFGSSVKVTKSAISKLAVAELRAECQRLGLPDDGLKPALVERVFSWLQQHGSPQQKLQASSVRQQSAANAVIDSAAASASRSTATALPGNVVSTPAPAAMAAQATAAVPAASSPVAMTSAPGAIGASDSSSGSSSLLQPGQQSKHSSNVRVTWLGTSSGSPTARRNVSAIAVRFDDDIFLVDCGEGTRNQLQRAELDPAAIRTITVTHMHGDHCFGVGGVIQAVCEARLGGPRQNETLHIWGPPELQAQVFGAVRMGVLRLTTPVLVTGFVLDPSKSGPPRAADPEGMLHFALQGPDQAARIPPAMAAGWQAAYDQGSERIVQQGLSWTLRMPTPGPNVVAAQLQHRVPCWGYVFQEEPQVVPPPAAAAAAPGTGSEVAGAEGGVAGQQWVRPGRKLVILGDTCNSSSLAPLAADCDLLSHEATFCSGMEDKAAVAQHSTTEQAGAFAAAVDARNLVLTHFSARYESMAVQPQQRRATDRPRPAPLTGVLGQELGGGEMRRLLEETQSTYGKDSIFLANDFFTFKVAPHAPVPAEELAAQQAQRQARAIEVTRAAQAAASATSGKREQQRYYSQQASGGGGRQQGGYQQRRPGGGGGGGRSQQRRPRPAGQR
ncbi:hypothetical protein D9Q98_004536 [Chlorella vulgaris]|uniref:SAP domain-containing protein n=1 Tax=Chlorella vulgaris TaxID=3077 RepID=A0A9D4TQ16_CHLVU|nr:hypothetical protein D9Q98_004536 [Chlorella vulgaris]